MKSAFILIFLVASCSAVAKSAESTETSAPSDHSQERDVAGTVDPKQPLNVDAPVSMCRPNETYTTCGTSCELSCDNQLPVPCTPGCVRGCQCNRGYYRNRQRYCVLLRDCPPRNPVTCANVRCQAGFTCRIVDGRAQCVPNTPQCKPNESYKTCGTACEPSCERPNPGVCTQQCVVGCQCNTGYYRNRQGNCVRLSECPAAPTCATILCQRGTVCRIVNGRAQCVPDTPQCKPNESYKTCGTACEPSCERPNPGACTLQCVVGCQCNTGFYRDRNGNCVRLADCPRLPTCKANEVYSQCKSACEPSCQTPNPAVCPAICTPGCQCIRDYYRNNNGDCVRLNQCSPRVPSACQGRQCTTPGGCALVIPITCIIGFCTPQPQCVNYNPCAATTCEVGKDCVLRQVICIRPPCNPTAECITSTTQNCGPNETAVLCKNSCSERRCGQTPPIFCPPICIGSPGCACRSGYLRNTAGRCVTQQQC